MAEKKEKIKGEKEVEVAELYLETLLEKVDTNKYRLVTKILDVSHQLLEDKTDPLKESVDATLREAAGRMVKAAGQGAMKLVTKKNIKEEGS
jgi:hypothetical protein